VQGSAHGRTYGVRPRDDSGLDRSLRGRRAQPDPGQGRRARAEGRAGADPRRGEGRMSMTSIEIKTPSGGAAGTVELPAEVFNVQTNVPLIHQVVVAQLAAARQGTAKTKTR